MLVKLSILFILGVGVVIIQGQGNGGRNVADQLRDCYNVSYFKSRESRLPASINVLIDLIRQIEDDKYTSQDVRLLSIGLIHRFRQDGIRKDDDGNIHPLSLPYSPSGYQADRNRLVLRKLLPGSQENFNNASISDFRSCSLHYLVSNTFETQERLDEATVCGRLGRYTKRMQKRAAENATEVNLTVRKDVEQLAPRGYSTTQKVSQCPVESGVVYTKWGAIQAGTVIAAIAAGFEPQEIQFENTKFESIFGITLSGDIAETAFLQGLYQNFDIGNSGGWNSTTVPRWYFIERRSELRSMTDAEIRADLDGLILSQNVRKWATECQHLKLSQILDMYYSTRGVFSTKYKACNRNTLETEFVKKDDLITETLNYAILYDKIATFKGSVPKENFPNLIEPSVESYLKYSAQMQDKTCDKEERLETRIATDLVIVLDLNWPYETIHSAISYLLDNINVNKYESNITVINAYDGSIIVNETSSILDYHESYNKSIHTEAQRGVKLLEAMQSVENFFANKLTQDRLYNRIGTKSQIVLFAINEQSLSDASFVHDRINGFFKNYMPDVRFAVLAPGMKENYRSLVNNVEDVFSLQATDSTDSAIITKMSPLIDRIAMIPRRISNPRCSKTMSGDASSDGIELSVEPDTINYYKISPSYFYGNDARLKIQAHWSGLTVCTSRSEMNPHPDNKDNKCENLSTTEQSFALNGLCDTSEDLSACAPFYFSVSTKHSASPILRCTDCRFPDNVKYTLSVEAFGCNNSANTIFSSLLFISLLLYFIN